MNKFAYIFLAAVAFVALDINSSFADAKKAPVAAVSNAAKHRGAGPATIGGAAKPSGSIGGTAAAPRIKH